MRKQYVKPQVSKRNVKSNKIVNPADIDSDIVRMLTKEGFSDLFWERLRVERKVNPETTQEAVFDKLNEKYMNVIGCLRYSEFNSFRNVRDRRQK